MTKRKRPRGSMTAQEHEAWLRETGQYEAMIARQEAQEKKRHALASAIYAKEAPLVSDLREVGFEVDSAWDLFNRQEPWRKDLPIPTYHKAIPILIEHLNRSYPYDVRQGIVRALTDQLAFDVFDWLVNEFRRTADPLVAAREQQDAIEIVMAEARDLYTYEEIEQIMRHRWYSYRFVLVNAIVFHFQQEHIPLIIELIRDAVGSQEDHWKTLADDIRKKMRRWRRNDPELLAMLDALTST